LLDKDELSGESDFNINQDYVKDTLFYNKNETVKKQEIKAEIQAKILSGEISDNINGLKYALKNGCLPKLFTDVVKKLESEQKIKRDGDLNYSSTDIHKVKPYRIHII